MQMKTIYTVGHSSRSLESFCTLIKEYGIDCVVDIRRYPRSNRNPQFDRSQVRNALRKYAVEYQWIEAMGGFRKEGYLKYMSSASFTCALSQLESYAEQFRTAIMCAEESPLRCHRYHVSDALVARGWLVYHILGDSGIVEHHEQMMNEELMNYE